MQVVLAFRKPDGNIFILSVPEPSKKSTIENYCSKGFELESDSSADETPTIEKPLKKRKAKAE